MHAKFIAEQIETGLGISQDRFCRANYGFMVPSSEKEKLFIVEIGFMSAA